MHKDDVPQDGNPNLGGARKAMYARNDNGEYVVVPSNGWQVEETVTTMAVQEYKYKCKQAWDNVNKKLSSPLEYHMYANRLNIVSLAQETGIFRWRIKRHLKPSVFKRLSTTILQRYADTMGISVDTLRQLPPIADL